MTAQPPVLNRLLQSNAQWAKDVAASEPSFFPTTAKGQAPKVLWFGCADSRVPESVVTASPPGALFVHRNIANQFQPDDVSAGSVLQYAVDFVGVEHIVVAGHTGCGGAAACYGAATGNAPGVEETSPLAKFLGPLIGLAQELSTQGAFECDEQTGLRNLVEENVKRSVDALAQTTTIRNAWANGNPVEIHGWIYTLETGLIRDLKVSRDGSN